MKHPYRSPSLRMTELFESALTLVPLPHLVRDLDEIAVGVAEIDGAELAAGADAIDGAAFDGDVLRLKLGDDLRDGRGGQETKVGGAGRGRVGLGLVLGAVLVQVD